MDNDDKKELEQEEKVNPVQKYVDELKKQKEDASGKTPLDVRPEYLLPQFKNIEEQAKSYKELQALQTKQAQELAQFKKEKEANTQLNNMQMPNNTDVIKQNLQNMYVNEMNNLRMALQMGKISQKEAAVFSEQLKNFVAQKLQAVNYQMQNNCADMVSPKDYFQNDLAAKNYLVPICEFLETNYKKLSKKELDGVKNLVENLEKSLRDEILNDSKLSLENENYRQNLNSTANLNPQKMTEKIYTLEEIKNMKPDEFRKNQQTILEQFVARKIK